MKAQNTLTFIISRNYGHPISFSLPVWRVVLGGAVLAMAILALVLMSVLFLGTYPHILDLERERDELKIERDSLRGQILSANQKLYDQKEEAVLLVTARRGSRRISQRPQVSEDSAEGDYLPPVKITSIKTLVSLKWVEVVIRIARQGKPARNRGGFLIVVFENSDARPTRYVTSPAVEVNEQGFPSTYKVGVRFSRVRNAVTYRRKIRRRSPDDYFTHVTLYLFSLRGGLLVKDRFDLKRDLFIRNTALGPGPGKETLS